LGDRLAVGLRVLDPATEVRILVPQPWSHRLAVRTLASHARNGSSILPGTTMNIVKGLCDVYGPFSFAGISNTLYYATQVILISVISVLF
jgi:hypothetical protein